jgi:NADH:ubiquinone oxidoreductase subunit 6 (subunit J)
MGADALVFATLNPLVVVLISFVLASMLASIIVAFLVFRPYGPRLERFALLAGLNFLSIIALWLALRNERVKKYLIPTEEPIPAPGKMLYTDYLIGFSLAFIALLILIPATFLVVATT